MFVEVEICFGLRQNRAVPEGREQFMQPPRELLQTLLEVGAIGRDGLGSASLGDPGSDPCL